MAHPDGVQGGYKCIRYTLVFFNVLNIAFGIAVLVVGLADGETSAVSQAESKKMNRYLIGLGSTLIVIGFFGCAGAAFQKKCLLGVYFAILLIMAIYCLAIVSLLSLLKDQAEADLEKQFVKELKEKYGTDKDRTEWWDLLQREHECCGVKGDVYSNTSWAYYRRTPWYKNQKGVKHFVPESCCKKGSDMAKCRNTQSLIPVQELPVTNVTAANDLLFKDGCVEKTLPTLRALAAKSFKVTLSAFFVLMFTAILTCSLCLAVGRLEDE